MHANDVIFGKDLIDCVKQVIEYVHRMTSIDKSIFINEKLNIQSSISTAAKFKPNSSQQKNIYDIIMNAAISAEMISPGSFEKTLNLIVNSYSGNQHLNDKKKIGVNLDGKNNMMVRHQSTVDWETAVNRFIATLGIDFDMFMDAIKLAGFAGKIQIEKSVNEHDIIHKRSGFNFSLQTFGNIKRLLNTKIVIIDGLIENVSEVHNMLTVCSETKCPLTIVARGYSDDVLNTINVNNLRGSFQVLPLAAKFDIATANTLVDIAVISKSDIISSLKGELISTVKFDTLKYVDEINVNGDIVTVKNCVDVTTHIKQLQKKREEVDESVQYVYDDRIKSLSQNLVILKLKNDINFVNRAQKFDVAIRTLQSYIKFGIYEDELAATQYASEVYSRSCLRMINSLGAIIS